jgi:2-polyprenyl-3-methyl-5-hydroxy-6-metoxy-1,4-benzoquinol methylase
MPESADHAPDDKFDRFASRYEDMHAESVAMSGEGTEYFAVYKQKVLERIVGNAFDKPVLDFGCGIGNLTRLLVESFPSVHGYDPSSESLRLARSRAPAAVLFDDADALPNGHYGAIVLANVLHHVPPANRAGLMQTLHEKTAPGGRLVVFEHNLYNPVTRRVVALCPLDEVAELISPRGIKRLLEQAGYSSIERDFIVFFPRLLAPLRRFERKLSWLPLGAQVCVWGTKG